MSFSARYSSAVLLTILSLSVSLCAQTTTKETAKVSPGSISGRVTIKDRGAPGIAIGLRKGDASILEGYQRATTDPDGFYRISNLAPGSYSIIAAAPAFVVSDAHDTSKQKNVLVGDGENVEGINFELVRGGVITGRVTDADGRAVIEQQVYVYPAAMYEQKVQRTVYATGSAQTDDRGIYRVFGLPPGRYKVAVGRSDDERNITYNQSRNIFYKQVFHPDATDQTKATIIEVSEGSEADNIDITVGRTVQTFSASGMLVDESGQPVPNLRFGLQRQLGQRIEYMNNNSTGANSHGEFVVEGLGPGRYALFLFPNQNNDLRVESFTFDIVDHDLTGLTVKLTRGASITGIVVLENNDQAIFAKLLQLQLRAYGVISVGSSASFGQSSSSPSPINPDGSFRLAGLPSGRLNLVFAATGMPQPPKGFTITRIERDGIASQGGLSVKDGEQVTGVRVFVSYGYATLSGVVMVDNGSLPPKGRVFARLTKPGEASSNLRPAIVDERGRFLIDGIPPGSYELQTVVNLPGQKPRTYRRQVTLQDGQTMEVTINVDSSEPAKP
jgi:protocatechuate 3,4-dioxygenase beta subunit